MSSFVPTNYDLRTAQVFCYHLKKTAAESHRMLVEAYSEHALGKTQCFEWSKKFKSGNFDVRNEDRGKPPEKFEENELHRSANNGFVFVVGKRKIISGAIFDVESESEIRISLSRQDFEIFKVMCSKNGGFSLLLRLCIGRKKFFWFFSQMSSFITTLSLQNELLNSRERFFFHKDTAISSSDIYPNNLISIQFAQFKTVGHLVNENINLATPFS